jgi:hypothetical protein
LRGLLLDTDAPMHHITRVRLTVSLSDEHYRAAQAYSKAENLSLSEAVNRLIAFGFERGARSSKKPPRKKIGTVVFPTSRGARRLTLQDMEQIDAGLEPMPKRS